MTRLYARLFAAIFCLALLGGLGGPVGVAHADPGPRPTLTPIPPAEEPVVAPETVEEPAPTARPRRTFRIVVTPIAPVQPAELPAEGASLMIQPDIHGANFNARYAVPGNAAPAPPAAAQPAPAAALLAGVFGFRALLVALIALDVIAICILLRRRFATV